MHEAHPFSFIMAFGSKKPILFWNDVLEYNGSTSDFGQTGEFKKQFIAAVLYILYNLRVMSIKTTERTPLTILGASYNI